MKLQIFVRNIAQLVLWIPVVLVVISRIVIENIFGGNRGAANLLFAVAVWYLVALTIFGLSAQRKKASLFYMLLLVQCVWIITRTGAVVNDGTAMVLALVAYTLPLLLSDLPLVLWKKNHLTTVLSLILVWTILLSVEAALEVVGMPVPLLVRSDFGFMTTGFGVQRSAVGFYTQISAAAYFFAVLYLSFCSKRLYPKLSSIATCASALGIICTFSRYYIAWMMVFLIAVYLSDHQSNIGKKIVALILVATFFFLMILFLSSTVGFELTDLVDMLMSKDDASAQSNLDKISQYRVVAEKLSELDTFIVGTGPGTQIVTPENKKLVGDGFFLQFVLENGVPFGILYFFCLFFPKIIQYAKIAKRSSLQYVPHFIAIFAICFSIFINSALLDFPVYFVSIFSLELIRLHRKTAC